MRIVDDKRATLVLVDDEEDILVTMQQFLAESFPEVEVRTAANGEEALEVIDDDVDLLLTDYRMPRMDGLELLRRIQQEHARIPCILLTAYPDMDLAIDAVHEARIIHFFTKPLKPVEVRSVIGDILRAIRAEKTRRKAFERVQEVMAARRERKGTE